MVLLLEPSSTYRIEIVTDAQALLDKLRHADGVGPVDPSSEDLGRELDARGRRILTRIALAADEHPLIAAARWSVAPPTSPGAAWSATIVLEGTLPHGVRHLTWSYGWTFAKYAFSVRRPDGSSSTEWLDGDQLSAPVPWNMRLLHCHEPPSPRSTWCWALRTSCLAVSIMCSSCSAFICSAAGRDSSSLR